MMRNLKVIFALAICISSCGGSDKKAAENNADSQPIAEARHSDAFNESFEKMLVAYYGLRDGLVDYDTVKANGAARDLARHADSLSINGIKGDSTGVIRETAGNYKGTIAGSALGLNGETDLVKKKREFQMISNAMYDLIRTVQYDGQKVYYQRCPMAFGEEEAYWISNSAEIVNPYLGKQHPKYKSGMLHCGELTDSLDFSKQ